MRGLKTDFGLSVPGDDEGPTVAAATASAPLSAPAPLLRALENKIAAVATGSPSLIVLALAASEAEHAAAFAELARTTARRSFHATVPAEHTSGSIAAAVLETLVEALVARTRNRPGVASILDPLIDAAAPFVLGPDLPSVEGYLKPEALDESPAVAARIVIRRIVPALSAQVPQASPELLAALVRARCAGPDDAPELASLARTLGAREVLAALGALAARAGVAVVIRFAAVESPAAVAAGVLEIESGPGLVFLIPAVKEAWETQRALLSEVERHAVEGHVVSGFDEGESAPAPPPPPPPPPVESISQKTEAPAKSDAEDLPFVEALDDAPPAPPVPGAPHVRAFGPRLPRPELPPNSVPIDIAVKPAFQHVLRKSVAARLKTPAAGPESVQFVPASLHVPTIAERAKAKDAKDARKEKEAAEKAAKAAEPKLEGGAPRKPAATTTPRIEPPLPPRRRPSTAAKMALGALPFIFLATLPILGRPVREASRESQAPEPWQSQLASKAPAAAPTTVASAATASTPGTNTPQPNTPQAANPQAASAHGGPPAGQGAPPRVGHNGRGRPQGQPVALTPGQPPQANLPQPAPAAAPQQPQQPPAPQTPAQVIAALEKDVQAAQLLEGRILAIDRALPKLDRENRAVVLTRLLDNCPGSAIESEALKLAVVERLGPVSDMATVSQRLVAYLEPARPRGERLAALGAFSRASQPLQADARSKLATLAAGDLDASVEAQARAIVASLPPEPQAQAAPPATDPAQPNAPPAPH